MEVQVTKESKAEVLKALIDEFKKSEPDNESIEKFMAQLDLDYESDDFANMERVLKAMSFQSDSAIFQES